MSEDEQKQSNNNAELCVKTCTEHPSHHDPLACMRRCTDHCFQTSGNVDVMHLSCLHTITAQVCSASIDGVQVTKPSSQITAWLLLMVIWIAKYLLCFLQNYLMLTAFHQSLLHFHLKQQLKL